jgi:hypothetical protein
MDGPGTGVGFRELTDGQGVGRWMRTDGSWRAESWRDRR